MLLANRFRCAVFLFVVILLAAPARAQEPASLPVAEARDRGAGATVTVEGVVTRAYGAYVRLQDASGPTGASALVVRQTSGPQSTAFQEAVASGTIQPGTRLHVTGTLSSFYGLLQLSNDGLAAFTVAGQGDVPAPQEVTLPELIWNGEDYESELVRVRALRLPEAPAAFANGAGYEAIGPSGATAVLRVQDPLETALGDTGVPGSAFTYEGVVGQFHGRGASQPGPDLGYQLIPVRPTDLDAGAPAVALRGGYALAYEDGGAATATVRVSAFGLDAAEAVTLRVSDAGTATAGDVSGLDGGALTLAGGETQTVSLTARRDGEAEGIERLELALATGSDGAPVAGGRFTLWILDTPTAQAALYPNLEGQALLEALRADFATGAATGQPGPPTLGYARARDTLYARLFNEGGTVRGFYTGFEAPLAAAPDPSDAAGAGDINTEHVWPQSQGAEFEPARSNLHILAPAWAAANAARCNYPYAEIDDAAAERWFGADGTRGIEQAEAPAAAERSAYSEAVGNGCGNPSDGGRFEPRESAKGEAARKVFYFRMAYPDQVRNLGFFTAQRGALRRWHAQHPVSATEQRRNVFIASSQGDRLNPFQLDSTLVRRAFFAGRDAPAEALPIAEARQAPRFTQVTVEGVVTRAEGLNVRLQDGSGPTGASALVVRSDALASALGGGDVSPGDRLRVTGPVDAYNSLLQLNGESDAGSVDFEVLEEDAGLPDAQEATAGAIAASGEDYESELVRVRGVTIDAGGDDTFRGGGTDGNYTATGPEGAQVTLRIPGGSFYAGEPIPEGAVTFQGVAGQFSPSGSGGGYQLVAIDAGDLSAGGAALTVDLTRSFGDPDTPSGYRLVALPGDVQRPLAGTLDGTAGTAWQAYWDDGSDEDYFVAWTASETFDFRPGRGFWLIGEAPWAVATSVPAVERAADGSYALPLHEGWNIVSNPLAEDVAWSAIDDANEGALQPLWRFHGSYVQAETFASATGGEAFYFLNSDGRSTLTLPSADAAPAPAARAGSRPAPRALTLSTYHAGRRTSAVQVSTAPGAEAGLDAHDALAPPSRFSAARLRLPLPAGAPKRARQQWLAGEARPPGEEGYAFDLVLHAAPGTAVTVRAGGLGAFGEQPVRLVEPRTGRRHDLRSEHAVELAPTGATTPLRLLVGRAASEASRDVPEAVTLRPGYPNPFAESVTLTYALPEARAVRVAVYDLLGRRVRTLVDAERGAGAHTLRWDGESDGGTPLASGVYFVRLEAGDVVRSAKLVRVQ